MRTATSAFVFLIITLSTIVSPLFAADVPKVVLVGDSIRLSYESIVKQQLAEVALVLSPKANGQDSNNVLRHLDAWVIQAQPDIFHFNCGIHDTKHFHETGKFQVSPEQYEQNLRTIVQTVREKTNATVLFATSTPILDVKAAKARQGRDYELLEASILRYNKIANEVMKELNVPVNDLHNVLTSAEQPLEELIVDDGVHLTDLGKKKAADQVIATLRPYLEQKKQTGPWKLEEWKQVPTMNWLDQQQPIWSLTYENETFKGETTDVFAYYATPGTISGDRSKDKNLPAVVLIHGGGGTAFAEWTWLWAQRGYAAIAMDLSGHQPEAPQFNDQNQLIPKHRVDRVKLERGGPEQDHVAKFDVVGDDFTDDWQFHSVSAVMHAHSLIRSFPEVDPERTAVTGISWGGYMTCLIASLDDRFKAAVPVYGCGFLYDGESVQRPAIEKLSPEKQQEWIRIYDPSAWLVQCRVPILFVNGTNDQHYPLVSYMRSYDAVPGSKHLRIEPKMRHSHIHGWAPQEIGLFIDQHIAEGKPLPVVTTPEQNGTTASTTVTAAVPIKNVEFSYTTDAGPLLKRQWKSIPATISENAPYVVTATVPDEATIWMFNITDERDAMVSTRTIFTDR